MSEEGTRLGEGSLDAAPDQKCASAGDRRRCLALVNADGASSSARLQL
nr:unnamed protein product [Digitaria exilis]